LKFKVDDPVATSGKRHCGVSDRGIHLRFQFLNITSYESTWTHNVVEIDRMDVALGWGVGEVGSGRGCRGGGNSR
jgi:hypothetical protein